MIQAGGSNTQPGRLNPNDDELRHNDFMMHLRRLASTSRRKRYLAISIHWNTTDGEGVNPLRSRRANQTKVNVTYLKELQAIYVSWTLLPIIYLISADSISLYFVCTPTRCGATCVWCFSHIVFVFANALVRLGDCNAIKTLCAAMGFIEWPTDVIDHYSTFNWCILS